MDNWTPPDGTLRAQITQNKDGSLKAPKELLTSVAGARAIYYKYRLDSLARIDFYASVEGMIQGNPPFDPGELEKQGLSFITNYNDLTPRSLYTRTALALWNLLNSTKSLIKFELKGELGATSDSSSWCDIMAEEGTYTLRCWKGFNTETNTNSAQLIKIGVSPVFWPDERNWKFKTIEYQRFFIPDQQSSNIDELTSVAMTASYTAQYLYETYDWVKEQEGKGLKTPWNLEELQYILLQRANTFAKLYNWGFEFMDMMALQKRVQNLDYNFDVIFTDSILLTTYIYQEYTPDSKGNKITTTMFDPMGDAGDFLFKADRQYREMSDALVIFTASPGEFTIHSNRGLGHMIYSACQAMMMLDCQTVDGARMASTPLLRSPPGSAGDISQLRFYPGVPCNIGTAEFVENTIGENLQQSIGVSQYIYQKLNINLTNSGEDPGVPDRQQGSISDGQAKRQDFKEFSILKQDVAHYYSFQDTVYQNVFSKMLHSKKDWPGYDEAQAWKKSCMDRGVPPQVFDTKGSDYGLPDHLRVSAARVAGDGSTLARIMGLEFLAPDVGAYGAKGQKNYQKEKIMAVFGPEHVASFLPPGEPDEISGGASVAQLENNAMLQGQAPLFSPDNAQRPHIVTHLTLGHNLVQQISQQQLSAVDADKAFNQLIPHLGEHLSYISKNPYEQQFFETIKKSWGELQSYAQFNRRNAESELQAQLKKQQQDQAATQQVLNDEQRKDVALQGNERRATQKVQAQVQRAGEANQTRAQIMQKKVELDSDNQRLKVQLDAQNKKLKVTSEAQATPDASEQLKQMTGDTISTSDFEPIQQ